ncbi:MAG: hypothetical protein QOG15_1653 [Solirubrobacteraceae bacterium]|jgi:hypothetical protein|nr:hypothetical protein [Solirubrobacteraceae bacterium]
MSITYTCNLCGETIAPDEPFVTLNGNGERSENAWKSGWIGHYHSRSATDCWQGILDVVRAADGSDRRLAGIPTASDDEIAARRGTLHRLPLLTTDPFFGLSLRTRELLLKAGIDGAEGLRAILADGSVSGVPGIGPKRLIEIRAALEPDADVG